MISAHHIEWNSLDSLEFDLITCLSFDSDNGSTPSFLNQDGIYTEHYDGHRTIHRAKTNEYFNPTFTFIKDGFEDFSTEEQRSVLGWLSSGKPGWLNVYQDDSNVISFRCFGIWESIELYKLGNSRVVGYVVSFASSHPYAFSQNIIYPEVHETIDEISENNLDNDWLTVRGVSEFTIDCETDEYGKLLYPKVTIQFDDDEYIELEENPTINGYDMLSNVIYKYDNNDYIHMPNVSYKGQVDKTFTSSPIEVNIGDNQGTIGEYCYFKTQKAIYRAVRVCEEAISFVGNASYYVDEKGLTLADPQPTVDNFQEKTYYVQSKDTNGTLRFNWEFITSVGTGVRIENTSVKNALNSTTSTELVGCTVKDGDGLGEEIILDGTNKVISSSITTLSTFGRTFGNDFNWVWPPLAYGENKFVVTGNCKIRFEWIEPRKVGSL